MGRSVRRFGCPARRRASRGHIGDHGRPTRFGQVRDGSLDQASGPTKRARKSGRERAEPFGAHQAQVGVAGLKSKYGSLRRVLGGIMVEVRARNSGAQRPAPVGASSLKRYD